MAVWDFYPFCFSIITVSTLIPSISQSVCLCNVTIVQCALVVKARYGDVSLKDKDDTESESEDEDAEVCLCKFKLVICGWLTVDNSVGVFPVEKNRLLSY